MMFEDIERIIVETKEGEKIATIINDDKVDESIIVADGYTVRIKPKTSQPLREKVTYEEAIKMAIEALEKQIPKKLIKYDIDYSGNPLFRCPVCGDSWNSNEFGDGIEYCWTCGQALDWSDADDN